MAQNRATSLKDVAQAAGVSVATVSRLLNGSLELPAETKARIDTAIRDLNYVPNPHARRLSRGRSDTIGLVVPDIGNPFFGMLVAAVEEAADQQGLAVSLFATLNRTGREISYLRLLARNHVDGLVFITNHPETDELAELINATGKVVVVDEDVQGALVPKLFCDNEQGGRLAGAHLADHGHRRVLYVGGADDMLSAQRRYQGCQAALFERFGSDALLHRYCGDYTIEFGRDAARKFLAEGRPATAIFASSDEIAIGMMEVLRAEGIRVPEDVSMIGFDDVAPLHLFAPALTAIRQPVRAIGQRALSLLLETNWDERSASATEELLPVEIVVRSSVAPPSTA
ncbi:LacI family DNA-binding transcriptional regulator [Rhizobium sp. SL86]|uniref:LacI family DNA-binding transcriptional regulator n=1 Tax=Rhizobium sp. SL86 TaxID=2995148 RepID=UPI002276F930|nr:LacI family DNA-binding transcriptional regulator [Rhizobium sp. SL86]MCY1666647.1 LacI family DNA-binding transcriptional regulator [Rhizobium sp. SL86]